MTGEPTKFSQSNNPEKSLIVSMVASSHATDLLEKIGEVPLDTLFSNDVMKEVPILGLGVSLYRAGNAVAAHISTKKIMFFLSEIEKIPAEKWRQFFDNTVGSEENQKLVKLYCLV